MPYFHKITVGRGAYQRLSRVAPIPRNSVLPRAHDRRILAVRGSFCPGVAGSYWLRFTDHEWRILIGLDLLIMKSLFLIG